MSEWDGGLQKVNILLGDWVLFFYCFVFAVCCVFFPLISLRFSCGILPGMTTMTLISLMTTELLLSGFFGCPNSEEDFIIPTQ